jgi:hypothetical protein
MTIIPGVPLAHMTKKQREKLTPEEFKALIDRTDRLWADLEAARAAIKPVKCAACADRKVVAEATGDPIHPTKLVPCPECGEQPSDPDALIIDPLPLLEYYESEGVTQEKLLNFGED